MPTHEKKDETGPQSDGVGQEDELTPEGQAMQDAVDEINAKGYMGVEADPTPDGHYTVAGVLAGKPTPETHPEQAAAVGSTKFR